MTKRVITLLVLFATVSLTTVFVAIPVGVGFFNFSDVAVVFSGLFIAHFIGDKKWGNLAAAFLVAGLGTACADLYLGYGIFAPMTFIAKGLEAAMAYLSFQKKGIKHLLILLIGGVLMVATYFIGEAFFLKDIGGMEMAIGELFPTNTIQLFGGLIGGRVLFLVASKIIKKN
ncbi:MAG: ECF transporter S component [Spirochaetaceae bacterium]